MPSRRDQVHSYQFFVQRMTSALVARDPDPEAAPFRRLGGAGLGGIMVAVLAMLGVGLYGLIRPGGNTSWQDGKSVIVEKETGARYIYRDKVLHPVANYASALLALGSSATVQVSRNSLLDTPRGNLIGIPDAPDALPDPKRMLSGPWTLCSQPTLDPAGETVATTVLAVGQRVSGGREAGEDGLLVRNDATGTVFLVWHNHSYEIPDDERDAVLEGLTWSSKPVVSVGDAWLNALPAGEKIESRFVDGRGGPSSAIPDGVVGRVYVVKNTAGGEQYYLAAADQLVPLTSFEATIQLADEGTRDAYAGEEPVAVEIGAGTAASADKAKDETAGDEQAPAQQPDIATLTGDQPAVCAEYGPGEDQPRVMLDAQVETIDGQADTTGRTAAGVPLADRVLVEPGYGVIVRSMDSPDAPTGTLNLVTDQGYRYQLASDEVPAVLGYTDATAVELPSSLVVRIPAGPTLDPAVASNALN